MKNLRVRVAVGVSRMSKHWENKEMLFSDFCEIIKNPVRTSETVSEFKSYPSEIKADLKDVGGFIGGWLNDSRRTKDSVVGRTMWTADLDNTTTGFMNNIDNEIKFLCVVYSTHSHTPENPRLRIVAPFSREVTPSEYPVIAKYITNKFDPEMFDNSATNVNQLMYWSSCPKDGNFFYKEIDGEVLDVDGILNSINSKETNLEFEEDREVINMAKYHSNPKSKRLFVGLFCRTYTITDVLRKFLSSIYIPTEDKNRYTYRYSNSYGGLVVINDLYAYAHQSSDNASKLQKKALNAFDLVCEHLYGNSAKDAIENLKNDPNVKKQLMKEKYEQSLGNYRLENPDLEWVPKLTINSLCRIEDTINNLVTILENDIRFRNFGYNTMSHAIEIINDGMPWTRFDVEFYQDGNRFWTDYDTSSLKYALSRDYINFEYNNFNVAFTKVAHDRSFQPIVDYLNSLPEWDGVERVDSLLINTMQADNTPYVKAVTRKTLVAAVARSYQPGIKYDNLLVLDGAQGIGKSTLFRDLVGDRYYSNALSLTDMADKTAAEKLQGVWVIEVDELSGMRKADIEKVKGFFSSVDDRYRHPYAREVESHPRQCIIIATVNGDMGYLRDITGNRRFWPVKLHQTKQKINWKFDDNTVNQIWAEAKKYYLDGEKLYLEGDIAKAAEKAQLDALEIDENIGFVEGYLNTKLPENWDDIDIQDRYKYLNGEPTACKIDQPTKIRTKVCTQEIWCECFGRPKWAMETKDSRKIIGMLLKLGWKNTGEREYITKYDRQRIYVKQDTESLSHHCPV